MFYFSQSLLSFICIVILLETVSSAREKMFIVKIKTKDVYTNCAGTEITEHAALDTVNDVYSNCAGTIITKQAVLTAAHCVHKKKDISVIQFAPNETHKYEVDAVFVHPDFNFSTFCNDIALIKIKTNFRKPWEAAVLNDIGLRSSLNIYENCKMVGWSLNDDISFLMIEKNKTNRLNNPDDSFVFEDDAVTLTRVPVKIITSTECSKKIKNFGGNFSGKEKLCGVNAEQLPNYWCSIGPGGPLLCPSEVKSSQTITYLKNPVEIAIRLEHERSKHLDVNATLGDPLDLLANLYSKRSIDEDREYQIAVVSWGKICSKVPSVFVRTDTNYEWIKETIGNFDSVTNKLVTYTTVFGTTSKSVTAMESVSHLCFFILLIINFY